MVVVAAPEVSPACCACARAASPSGMLTPIVSINGMTAQRNMWHGFMVECYQVAAGKCIDFG